MTPPIPLVKELNAEDAQRMLDGLAVLLERVVRGGASVNFVAPFSTSDSRDYWATKALPGIKAGTRRLWVTAEGETITGCVMLDLDMPPNQVHRGEVSKMLVDPDFRRRGLARGLLSKLEAAAQDAGLTLLTLDTTTGSNAERLYGSVGFQAVGSLPGFSKAVFSDDFEATTYMYKPLTH